MKDPTVRVNRCGTGHYFFYPHPSCPVCAEPLQATEVAAAARLIAHTTVRVTPSGQPLRLGLAELPEGARTLCELSDDLEPETGGEVTLRLIGSIYRAERA